MKAVVYAGPFLLTIHERSEVVRKLPVQGHSRVCNFVAPMQPLDCLLRPKGDQNADDDYADLATEFAPAVKRFGKMEMHVLAPALLRERNRRANVRNGWKADMSARQQFIGLFEVTDDPLQGSAFTAPS